MNTIILTLAALVVGFAAGRVRSLRAFSSKPSGSAEADKPL